MQAASKSEIAGSKSLSLCTLDPNCADPQKQTDEYEMPKNVDVGLYFEFLVALKMQRRSALFNK
jgi:hypothetical protein